MFTDRQMHEKDVIYIHTHIQQNSAIKKNERLYLEMIILSEVSQTEKDKYHMILLISEI